MTKQGLLQQQQRGGRPSSLPRRRRFHVPTVALAVAATLACHQQQPVSASLLEAAKGKDQKERTCATTEEDYGCPLLPLDIHYHAKAKQALDRIRTLKRTEIEEGNETFMPLDSTGTWSMGTLTLIGYKGGTMESQINQDRAFCVSPYHVTPQDKRRNEDQKQYPESLLLGVFDGHAKLGELVSQYSVATLPKVLATKLQSLLGHANPEEKIKQALFDTFLEINGTAPAEVSGGCTASVVLQQGRKLYFANAGDSQSFLVVYREKSQTSEIVYVTREDKPHLADEKARVEAMGGTVYIPPMGGTSRVMNVDPKTGMQSGLAMSRSIGDWVYKGVIPDPLVDVVDIPDLVAAQLKSDPSSQEDDVHLFAVSATDGMMDYVSTDVISQTIAISMYNATGPHLLTALEQLIYHAAQGWETSRQGRYRDDIAISVSQIRKPQPTKQ